MVGRAHTVAVVGLEPVAVTVEAHVAGGLPGLHVIGSAGSAAREATDRVKTALAAIGVTLPSRKALVSLAPAEIPKAGARFDLAMAVALLCEQGEITAESIAETAFVGELALDASVRGVPGVLPSAAALSAWGIRRLVVADANAAEAALVTDLGVLPVTSLDELVGVLRGERSPRPVPQAAGVARRRLPDLSDVRGQAEARRALELAAAGGHHLLLVGPPGCGKSMLAARLPSILPPLDRPAALEVAAVRSVAGLISDGEPLDHAPPFVAPHHSMSAAALLGGGSGVARPGALSLAHRGVLFLDELFEWGRALLESLREPVEEGVVRVARARATVRYPSRVQLVCAANPCPCGGGDSCACTDDAIWGYRSRLSGPLADRLDLAPHVDPLTADDLLAQQPGEPSAAVATRVAAARQAAMHRWGAGVVNATAPPAAVRAPAEAAALGTLAAAVERGELTGRGFDRALRVARTCADLEGSAVIRRVHALEARAHRLNLRPVAAAMARTG
ncbi:YifB family Mg chelatase-like AAA ATPase [soil metagenome]